jgi:hypothetical protein
VQPSAAPVGRQQALAELAIQFEANFKDVGKSAKLRELLADRVVFMNGNGDGGCKEKDEPCINDSAPALQAVTELHSEGEHYLMGNNQKCNTSCCEYDSNFQHGDFAFVISKICYDDSATPKINKIVADN